MPAATVATRYAPCWPVGQNLCNNRPLIWGGAAPAPLPPRSAARPCPTRPCLPSTRRWLSSSFTRQSPCCCLNFFGPSPLRCMWQRPSCTPPPQKRGRQKLPLPQRMPNNGWRDTRARHDLPMRTRAIACFFSNFFLAWLALPFSASLHASCNFFCVRHVFGTTCRFF